MHRPGRVAPLWLPLVLLALGPPGTAGAAADGATVAGVTIVGPAGVRVPVSELMARAGRAGRRPSRAESDGEEELEHAIRQPDRSHLPQDPDSPAAAAWPSLSGDAASHGRGAAVTAPQSLGLSFTGATSRGINPTFSYPPDCMGAIGPTQFVVCVNDRIVTFDRFTGLADGVLNTTTNAFFAPVLTPGIPGGATTSDPRIRYDRLTGRWFLTIINLSRPNRILIAVSDAGGNGSILAGSAFTFFYVQAAANCFVDYPTLAVDANALYVGTNDFCPNAYAGSSGYVIRKSSLLGAGPIVTTVFTGLATATSGMFTPQPADNVDPNATEGYFVGVDITTFGRLQFRRVSDPGGAPTLSGGVRLSVLTTNLPLRVDHLGNTSGTLGRLDGIDDRLIAAHVRNGRLWATHNVGVDNAGVANTMRTRDGVRWYELRVPPGSGSPTVEQQGTQFEPSFSNTTDQRNYWMGSVVVTGQGHAALGFSTAGTLERINAGFTGRYASDPHGAMQPAQPLTHSASAYNTGNYRWGDYSYTSLDPLDDMTAWTVQQFCDTTDSYGVRVAQLLAPPPAIPVAMDDVPAGLTDVHVTLTGAAAGGAGFYDPGTDLPGVPAFRHLTVTFDNGGVGGVPPRVLSASYVNPATVALVLDASRATPGAGGRRYTVRVTNPDGQSASAAILRVVPAPTVTASAGAGEFGAPVEFAAGAGPGAVALGDVDGDGRPDLVVASAESGALSVLAGDGAGGFAAAAVVATLASPAAVAIADMNLDGLPDLVATSLGDDTVTLLHGDGAGGFVPGGAFATGAGPRALAVADLDGDGRPDVAVANEDAHTISVLPGLATGGLAARTDHASGAQPVALAIADLNGDGAPDLAVGNRADGTVSVLLGDGSGGFGGRTDYAAGSKPGALAIADVSREGAPDLVITGAGDNTLAVLLGTGAGGFKAAEFGATGGEPVGLSIADLDGDARPDLAVACREGVVLSVFSGLGAGGFAAGAGVVAGLHPGALAIGDVNGDGVPDAVTVQADAGTVAVMLGRGGAVSPPGATAHAFESAAAVTVSPAAGYFTSDVNVDGSGIGPLASYEFTALVANHAVSAAFRRSSLGVQGGDLPEPSFAVPVVYPNPSWGRPTLALSLRSAGTLRVGIYDLGGRRVCRVADQARAAAGTHRFVLGGSRGAKLPAGLYFYRVETAGGVAAGRFVVLE